MKPKQNATSPAAQALDRFSAFFQERSAAHGIVGASLRVVGFDGVLRHTSFGLKDRATGAATDEATIYHWASITKTLTGIAIMQLRDRGRLALDDSIRQVRARAGGGPQPLRPHERHHSAADPLAHRGLPCRHLAFRR